MPPERDYTGFVTINDLEGMVDGHMRMLDMDESFGRERDNDLYRNYSSTPEMLDALILMGAAGVNVDKHWDGVSVAQGMMTTLEQLRNQIEANDVAPMELVDRFSRLFERRNTYESKGRFSKVVDQSESVRIEKSLGHIMGRMKEVPASLVLATTELCDEAQHYLAAGLVRNSFTPSPSTVPQPSN